MRYRAAHYDTSDSILLVLYMIAVIASLVGITGMVMGIGAMPKHKKVFRLDFLRSSRWSGSWLFLHTVLALHYATSLLLAETKAGTTRNPPMEAARFPGSEAPDYSDFPLFFIRPGSPRHKRPTSRSRARRIRRLAIAAWNLCVLHFNTLLLALTVNVRREPVTCDLINAGNEPPGSRRIVRIFGKCARKQHSPSKCMRKSCNAKLAEYHEKRRGLLEMQHRAERCDQSCQIGVEVGGIRR